MNCSYCALLFIASLMRVWLARLIHCMDPPMQGDEKPAPLIFFKWAGGNIGWIKNDIVSTAAGTA